MKVATTILHVAHDKFEPYWKYDSKKGLGGFSSPSFDSATVRSRDTELVLVDKDDRGKFESYPPTEKKADVRVYNLLNELIYFNRTADFSSEKLAKVKLACETYPQIMICLHGYAHDAVNGYARKGEGQHKQEHQIHYRSLAYFIFNLIRARSKEVRILLSMCYAARSENYSTNHEFLKEITTKDVQSSFAYRFGSELARKLPKLSLRLTARTGALAFDYETGKSLVQKEDAILASEYLKELRAEVREIEETNVKSRSISDMIELQNLLKTKTRQLRTIADGTPKTPKYGKWIYEFNGKDIKGKFSVKVTNKYPPHELLRQT
ncbi:hypothetical protein [Corallococcus silvisoli]|uniref:hypothetical protein n=1 Tax=Corallococcus silvisoli TaxID=2697031 RepID=UPI0013775D0D|nr:hypothetical protein [Corallococcus silvisoli]NBD14529.1 hypothetical protein [Corallococcus silvisoli]